MPTLKCPVCKGKIIIPPIQYTSNTFQVGDYNYHIGYDPTGPETQHDLLPHNHEVIQKNPYCSKCFVVFNKKILKD